MTAHPLPVLSSHEEPCTYWYEGRCPHSGAWLRLPRTPQVEAIAQALMQQLATDPAYAQEGKMYGVLLVETVTGEQQVLQAFSGLLQGQSVLPGWVPPIPGREQIAWEETQTLATLAALKQELIDLQQKPERSQYAALAQTFEQQLQQLALIHTQRKQTRQQQRQHILQTLTGAALANALEHLDQQSRQDGIERRHLKRQRDAVLQPLQQQLEQWDARIAEVKQQRKQVSRQLQTQMQAHYWLTNFAGESRSLHQLLPGTSLPTGTGDCCAPKLLHYAATHRLKPLAMAEFWWGPPSSNGDKLPGVFYGACADRCQPLMGFLLSGLPQQASGTMAIVYEDSWVIAVDKPAGLLSVPGRSGDRQDSALSRLQAQQGFNLSAVHRLDQDTSGLLLVAKDPASDRHLRQQFQQRQVQKVYEAVLAGTGIPETGVIDLPLWADPSDRPYQKVDWRRGKPSLTQFRVLASTADTTRVELIPVTGRTHQLRVHAADQRGLGLAILGDRLYGHTAQATRLHLHARELQFHHPRSGESLHWRSATPF